MGVAVVTGGNRGLGFEACRQLAKRGFTVVLTSRDATKGKEAQKKLAEEGLSVDFHVLDTTDEESIASFHDYLKSTYPKIHVLLDRSSRNRPLTPLPGRPRGCSRSTALPRCPWQL